jgi:hypothetical protein
LEIVRRVDHVVAIVVVPVVEQKIAGVRRIRNTRDVDGARHQWVRRHSCIRPIENERERLGTDERVRERREDAGAEHAGRRDLLLHLGLAVVEHRIDFDALAEIEVREHGAVVSLERRLVGVERVEVEHAAVRTERAVVAELA